MLKTISAAVLAVSVIAAPAFAAEAGKTTTPVIKADQTQAKTSTTTAKPDTTVKADAKAADVKAASEAKAMNANAAITPNEHKSVRAHRHQQKQVSAKKLPKTQPDVTKPVSTDKRG